MTLTELSEVFSRAERAGGGVSLIRLPPGFQGPLPALLYELARVDSRFWGARVVLDLTVAGLVVTGGPVPIQEGWS